MTSTHILGLVAAVLLWTIALGGDCADSDTRTGSKASSGGGSEVSACQIYDGLWEKLTKQGAAMLKAGKYGEAEKLFQAALKEAQKSGKPDLRLAESCENLAALYQARGQFPKSEPLLEKAMSARGRCLGVESPEVLVSLARLGQFYLAHGKTVKAERLYAKLIEFTDKKFRREQRAVNNLTELMSFYNTRPEFGGACDLTRRLQDMTQAGLKNQYPELAVALDRLGATYQQKNKLSQAEELFKRALVIREKALAPDHLALASSYENLASIYLAQGRYALAEPLYKKSLEISEKIVGTQRGDTFTKVAGLAQCYSNLGKHAEAEAMYQHVLDNADRTGNSGSLSVANCLIGLAQLYKQDGKYAEAEPLLKRALTITEAVYGPQHCSLSPILDSYADVLQKTKRAAEAAKLLARARSIRGT